MKRRNKSSGNKRLTRQLSAVLAILMANGLTGCMPDDTPSEPLTSVSASEESSGTEKTEDETTSVSETSITKAEETNKTETTSEEDVKSASEDEESTTSVTTVAEEAETTVPEAASEQEYSVPILPETSVKVTEVPEENPTEIGVSDTGSVTDIPEVGTITETTTDPTHKGAGYILVPDVEAKIPEAYNMSVVEINGVSVDISDITLAELLRRTGLEYCSFGSTSIYDNGFNFQSGMFGIRSDKNDPLSFEGTMVSIEVVDENGNVVLSSDLDESKFSTYKVKGVSCDSFWTHDDFEVVVFGGIKSGTSEDYLNLMFGEDDRFTTRFNDFFVYSNGKQVLMVDYDDHKVDNVYVINI